jgi:predicted ATPase
MRIVFTGGPGSGKTTIIEKLEKLGYKIISEPARTLIAHYDEHSPELHPKLSKENRKLFQKAIENKNYADFKANEYGFFDRSALDEVGYRSRFKIPISEELDTFCKDNRYDMVFFFPFWKEIYKTDSVRHETPAEAETVSKFIFNAYTKYRYDPLIVPKIGIEHRLEYILSNIISKK